MKRHIGHPRVEGTASRQAHCDLPPGTFEREMSKEGFFGPAAFFHHKHPPTGWSSFEGPLRPHAFDLTKLDAIAAHPWAAAEILYNAHCRIRFWRTAGRMDGLARNADGDELVFVHQGSGDLYCDFGHLPFEAGDYIVLPRGTMWRLDCAEPCALLLVEANPFGAGRGTAVTRAAVEAAGDLRDLWIIADDEDRPKKLYARLGFRPAWVTMEFLRPP